VFNFTPRPPHPCSGLPLPSEKKAGWVPEPVGSFWIIEKYLTSTGIRTLDSTVRRLVTSDYATSTIILFVAYSDPIVTKREGIAVSCRILLHYRSCVVSGYGKPLRPNRRDICWVFL
jgi:hypothetical protein